MTKWHVIAVLLLFCLTACTKTGDYPYSTEKIPDQESWQSRIIISRSGKKSADIYAQYLVKYASSQDYYISDSMRVDFFDDGVHSSYIVADSGVINEGKENIIAIGNVVIYSDSGFTAFTDKLFWINDSNKVYTRGAIQIYSKEDTLYGTDFESDPSFDNWIITKPLGKTRRSIEK